MAFVLSRAIRRPRPLFFFIRFLLTFLLPRFSRRPFHTGHQHKQQLRSIGDRRLRRAPRAIKKFRRPVNDPERRKSSAHSRTAPVDPNAPSGWATPRRRFIPTTEGISHLG